MVIKEGDWVLLYIDAKRNYLARVRRGHELHTDEGVIALDELIGSEYGSTLRTHLGVKVIVTRPTLVDIILRGFKRSTQIIYPKDAAFIVLNAGVGPGSVVVEAGTGTGALTAILAYLVRPSGKVYTYEIRKEILEVAKRNLRRVGLDKYVEFKHRDVRKGIDERNVDAVVLDLPDPWTVLGNAYAALRSGGVVVCFVPTVNQLERTVCAMKEHGFIKVEGLELLERRYKVLPGETRPVNMMIGHTGFIAFARRP